MAVGGAPISQESHDLLRRAAASRDKNVRGMAEYALRVAVDLQDVPMVRKEQEREVAEALRPAALTESGDLTPIDGPPASLHRTDP